MNALRLKVQNIASSIQLLLRLMKNANRQMKIQNDREYSHIDFENGIIHGKLQQIRNLSNLDFDSRNPSLTSVWCCDIPAHLSKTLIMFIREYITPFDTNSLPHIKRFDKLGKNETKTYLRAIVCSQDFIDESGLLKEYIEQNIECNDEFKNVKFYTKMVPVQQPGTKEIAQEWSQLYWPMSWKGNPYYQELKTCNMVLRKEQDAMTTLLTAMENAPSDLPIVTMFARENPGKDTHEIIKIFYDNRNNSFLEHSILNAIAGIAEQEKSRRSKDSTIADTGYLCQNLLVYTSHEPCIMCCMALVHSRISKITYIKPVPSTGGLESHYQLGDRPSLNWRFKIWKWIGEEEMQKLESIDTVDRATNFHA
ncbi:hypothetical protein QFC19_006888 [Naganishia cerealis]|uniref:Uncharacterized protein n=1 Tax=Naganishia cerealis TaxID=610337 RepID=A0ACC2VDG4_9TREE|nr:hypothetical protein QFC19_006888 [Naganishia cerealis]